MAAPAGLMRQTGKVRDWFRFGSGRNAAPIVGPERDGFDLQESLPVMQRELQEQLAQRESEVLVATSAFLPRILQRPLCDNDVTVMHRCTGSIVFSDASGFTKLTETLAQRADGAEVLSKSLNKFFTPLIDIIEAYRGDVIKFSGDALSILFEATDDYEIHPSPCGSPGSDRKTPLQLACLRASACCLEIHKRLHNFDTGEGGVRLTLHIGVGAGNITLLQVGGDFGRYEYVIAGTPMEQIAIAEPLAGSGETVLSPQTWNEVAHTAISGEPLTEGPPGFHRLLAFNTQLHTYPTVKQAASDCSRIDALKETFVDPKVLLQHSERFIPRAVLKHLRSGNSSSTNEMRSVTIIFAQIGGVDVSTDHGAKVAQQLMLSMQRACYNSEGNLNKFLVDDKGLLFLFVFGLPPVVHIDDPTRAIVSCFEMVRALRDMGLVGRFGVTTGRVFCGIVGSNRRREYTVMGDTVNLSARLMAKADENSVLVDEATFLRSQRDVNCQTLEPIMVKGKSQPIPIFAPDVPVVHGLVVGQLSKFLSQRDWNRSTTPVTVNMAIHRGEHGDIPDALTVQMPWRAASKIFGGSSPLLQLKRWRDLQKVDQLLAEPKGLLSVGGGVLLLGASGIGKQELAEHIVHSGLAADLLPLFGSQFSRLAERWRAVAELVQNCLIVLCRIHLKKRAEAVAENAEALLTRFVALDDEIRRVLVFLGFAGFKAPSGRPATEHELEVGAARLLVGLVTAVAESRGVLVVLRIRQGTSVHNISQGALALGGLGTVFWRLSSELSTLALQRRRAILDGANKKPILVVTMARSKPDRASFQEYCSSDDASMSETGSVAGTAAAPEALATLPTPQRDFRRPSELFVSPLTEDAVVELVCLCLGVSTSDGGSLVKRRLREFVIAMTINIPAYIQECIKHLLEAKCLIVADGECNIAVPDLNKVEIAEWVHTAMVGGTLSILESLGSAKQHVMKFATIFDGSFSPLDLAAANRVLFGRLPKTVTFHDMAKLCSACSELVKLGLLTRVTFPAHAQPPDRAPASLPRWTISNTLVRRVAGSLVLNSYRMLLKRAVLIERALNVELPKRLGKGSGKKKRKAAVVSDAPEVADLPEEGEAKTDDSPGQQEGDQENTDEVKELLRSACASGNLNAVLETLATHKEPDMLAAFGLGGYAPLHHACGAGHLNVVQLLCESGAIIDLRSEQHETPVLVAAQRGHLEVVKYLCEKQNALRAEGLCYEEYWKEMLPDILTDDGLPLPLSSELEALAMKKEDLNAQRKDIFEYLMNFLQGAAEEVQSSAPGSVGTEDDQVQDNPRDESGPSELNKPNGQELPEMTKEFTRETSPKDSERNAEYGQDAEAETVPEETALHPCRKTSKNGGRHKELRAKIRGAMRSRAVIAIMLIALVLALYYPDLSVCAGVTDNAGSDVVLSLVMSAFFAELVLLSLVEASYPLSFFFFMDCIGTISMIWDISFLFGSSATAPQESKGSSADLTLLRATRTAKIGARAGRLSRLVKIMRFLPGVGTSRGGQSEALQLVQISNQLTNVLSKRVACLTIILVIVLPLFTLGVYPENDFSMRVWMDALDRRLQAGQLAQPLTCGALGPAFQAAVDQFVQFYHDKAYGPYRLCSSTVCCDLKTSKFTAPERKSFQLVVSGDKVKSHFDYARPTRAEAEMGIALTSLALVLMCGVCLLLNYFASELAVRPLESMLGSIKNSAKQIFTSVNSLGEAKEDDDDDGDFDESMESDIALLEQVVKKIAALAELSSKKNPFDDKEMSFMQSEQLGVLAMTTTTAQVQRANDADDDGSANVSPMVPASNEEEVTVTMQWQLEEIGIKWELFNSWNFNPLEWELPKNRGISAWMVMNNPGSCAFTEHNVDIKRIRSFIDIASKGYMPNPYHNFMHAVDVTHAVFRYMNLIRARLLFSMLEQFAVLISAIAHDVGHPGLNNGFLTEVKHEIAIRYNDQSPLENMHCCRLFEITSQASANVFLGVPSDQYRDVRKLMIEVILHTDICQHPAMVKELENLYELNLRTFEARENDGPTEQEIELLSGAEHKRLIGKWLLHSADIANPTMPFDIAKAWTTAILTEYFAQGDQEKELGIPVQMLNDRLRVNTPHSQIGFIEFIIAPLVAAEVKIFPAMREISVNLEATLQTWSLLWLQEVTDSADEQRDTVRGRVQRVITMLANRPASANQSRRKSFERTTS